MITRLFFGCVGILLIIFVYLNVKKKQLSQDESIMWMFGAVLILILSIWPEIIVFLANIVGINYAPSLLFLLSNLFLLAFVFKNSQQISVLKEKNKELIQDAALMEKRIRDLERERDNG